MEPEHAPEESQAAMAELRTDGGTAFALHERNTIGRSDPVRGEVAVDLGGLPEGGYISRSHAEIWRDGDKWFIKDLGSSNGTFLVNGVDKVKVEGDTELADGQRIAFGTAELTFSLASDLSDQSDASDPADEPKTED